ncbi:MAG: tetratricopeptide repeat protein [Candidatus Heimdallarchaeota archaeon]
MTLLLGQIFLELGLAYHDLGQLQNAKTYMEKALAIHREHNNKPGLYLSHFAIRGYDA